MKELKIGIIGGGWMGTVHAAAYNNITQYYGNDIVPILDTIVDIMPEQAKKVCERYRFKKWSTNPDDVLLNPEIDIVVICTPNNQHVDQVIKAAKTGKAIFCEKPLGMNGEDAKRALDAVKEYGNITFVGFIYINQPGIVHARKLIESGVMGDIISFHGQYDMEYNLDPMSPHRWRDYDPISGALGDIGAHMLAISDFVVGSKITDVCGKSKLVYAEKPDPKDMTKMLPVTNDDIFNMIYTYENGALGNIVTSRVAPGNKVGIRFEVQCTKGAIRWDQERMNELDVYYASDAADDQGFKNIKLGPMHGEYGVYGATAGINISYVDVMGMQLHKFLEAVAEGKHVKPDIESGYEVNMLIDALLKSDKEHRWVSVSECDLR